jgi:hypothetical protein
LKEDVEEEEEKEKMEKEKEEAGKEGESRFISVLVGLYVK